MTLDKQCDASNNIQLNIEPKSLSHSRNVKQKIRYM